MIWFQGKREHCLSHCGRCEGISRLIDCKYKGERKALHSYAICHREYINDGLFDFYGRLTSFVHIKSFDLIS